MKRLSFWLTAGFVLFSFSGGFSKPTKSQLDSLEAIPFAAYSTADTIFYDNIPQFGVDTLFGPIDYWIGKRFTPVSAAFKLEVVYFQVANPLISTEGCQVLVVQDLEGTPDTLVHDTISTPLPNRLRSHRLSDSIVFNAGENFWILLGPVPGGLDNDSIGDGWWAMGGKHYTARSYFREKDSTKWVPSSLPFPDWVIRAGGEYSPPPKVVINEVMFAADSFSSDPARSHEWVELYNPAETQSTEGWSLINGAGDSVDLDNILMPSHSYLVIHFSSGQDDSDLVTDSVGHLYKGNSGFFDNKKDACALLLPRVDSLRRNYRDVVGWYQENLRLGEGEALFQRITLTEIDAHAKSVELDTVRRMLPANGVGPILNATGGISIGRNSTGFDDTTALNNSLDFAFVGGPNAAGPTMGKSNSLPMVVDNSTIQSPPGFTKPWTLMLYFAADNGDSTRAQERWCYDLLNQIEKKLSADITIQDSVNVVVWFDSRSAYPVGGAPSSSGTTFRGALRADATDAVKNLSLLTSNLNSGDPTNLADFINWVQAPANFPARHYALALKGDGAGWQGLCGDSRIPEDRLDMSDLKSALAGGVGVDTLLDLLLFDAPLMSQLEVAFQVKRFAHFMVASPEMTGPADFDYVRLVQKLREGDALAVEVSDSELAQFTVNSILRDRLEDDNLALWAAVQLDSLQILLPFVNQLASNLKTGVDSLCGVGNPGDNFQLHIRRRLKDADHYGRQAQGMADFIDLKHFSLLMSGSGAACNASSKQVALNVDNLLPPKGINDPNRHIVVARTLPEPRQIFPHDLSAGLSIYFPSSRQKAKPIDLARKTGGGGMYSSTSDHPFDTPGLRTESNITYPCRIYAKDLASCYPYSGDPCSSPRDSALARIHPCSSVANFGFVDSTLWDEFLIRYYKPVAQISGTGFVGLRLQQDTTFDASGSSDADSDSLTYIWDFYSEVDNLGSICTNYLFEDMDKNCRDDSTDEANEVRFNQPQVSFAFDIPGDREVWLHIWDETDSHLPDTARRYQVGSAKTDVQVDFQNVQLAFYSGGLFGLYDDAVDSIKTGGGIGCDIHTSSSRTGMEPLYFITGTCGATPHVIVFSGQESTDVFPPNMQIAFKNALDNDNHGFWVAAPRMGSYPSGQTYFDTAWNFPIPDSSRRSANFLVPVDREHFLKGLDTLELPGGTPLQRLENVAPPSFPLLVTNAGDTVAAAQVVEAGRRAVVFSTFGLENLVNLSDRIALLERILTWLTKPSSPLQPPAISLSGDFPFDFDAVRNASPPASKNLQINNAGGGTLNWTVTKVRNSDWLSATPPSGTAPSTVVVSITRTDLLLGDYHDTLEVSGNASNSPQRIPVSYTVSLPCASSLRGDMDGNGLHDPPDAVYLLICAFSGTGSCCANFPADVDCNGTIGPTDIVKLNLIIFRGNPEDTLPNPCTALFFKGGVEEKMLDGEKNELKNPRPKGGGLPEETEGPAGILRNRFRAKDIFHISRYLIEDWLPGRRE